MNACTADEHKGPFEPKPEWKGWLGFEWAMCVCCRSHIVVSESAATEPGSASGERSALGSRTE